MKFILSLLLALVMLQGTTSYTQFKPRSIGISVYKEALSLPSFDLFNGPFHPALTLRTDLWVNTPNKWRQTLSPELTYYYHRLGENALMLDAIYSIGYAFEMGLKPKLIGGIGYKHAFSPSENYTFKNGQYTNKNYPGTAHLNVKLGLGLDYTLTERLDITADYKFMLALPYSDALPFSVHTFIGIGINYKFAEGQDK